MEIEGAQSQINLGIPVSEIMVSIGRRAREAQKVNEGSIACACTAFCIKAFMKECPVQAGGIGSTDHSTFRSFSEESFMDLLGLLHKGSRTKVGQVGRKVFSFFLDHSLGRGNGFNPLHLPQEGEGSDFAQDHLFSWVARNRPECRKGRRSKKTERPSHYSQLILDV